MDNYGGNIQNRARFILAILQRIRAEVGDHFPVLIKINSEDFLEGGFTKEDMIYTAAMLERAGIDAIELSGGTIYSGRFIPVRKSQIGLEGDEAYYLEAAKLYKEKVNVPLILVGGIRSYGIAENIISSGLADYISLSRPLISEPGLINRWKSGDTRIADCQSDNLCFNPVMKGVGLHCVIKEKMRPKKII